MNKGTTKLNQNTKSHPKALQSLGYTVELSPAGDSFTVEGRGELVKSLDLTTNPGEVLLALVQRGDLLTYGTKVTYMHPETGEVKVASSVPMCLALGGISKRAGIPFNLSCLVVQIEKEKAAKPAAEANPAWAGFLAK